MMVSLESQETVQGLQLEGRVTVVDRVRRSLGALAHRFTSGLQNFGQPSEVDVERLKAIAAQPGAREHGGVLSPDGYNDDYVWRANALLGVEQDSRGVNL